MLSGAARTVLERRFGKKNIVHPKSSPPVRAPEAQLPSNVTATNVLVNNPAADASNQDTQSETTLVLAGSNIVVGFNDSGSFLGGEEHFTGYAHSNDAGTSFTDAGQLPDDPALFGDAGDPVLARNNTTGRVYFTTLGFNPGNRLQIFRSDDNGVTFGNPVQLGFTSSGDFQDKEWITLDNFGGSGQGNVYVAWRSFGDGIYFTRSLNHGDTWSAPLKLADEGTFNVQGAYVAVAPDHSVHVFWLDQSAGGGTQNILKTRKSIDQGTSFASAVTIATLMTTGTNGNLGLNGGFRTNSFPHVAINPVLGDIYIVWNDDVTGTDRSDIFISMSIDGGATWSAATNITDAFDSSTNDDFMPTVGVTPDGSKVMVAWYDRELDAGNSLIDRFGAIAVATAGTLTFATQFRISDGSWPVVIGQDPVVNSVYMGDYDQIVADNNFFYLTWGDNRLGNAFHTNQPDVRFVKITICAFFEAFNDAAVTWAIIKYFWSEIGENLVGTPEARKAIIETPAAFLPCDLCTIQTNVSASTDVNSKIWVYTHRIDKRTQIEILFNLETDKIIVKIKRLGLLITKQKASFVIDPNVFYNVVASYDGINYTVSINGTQLFSIPIAGLQMGKAGYAAKGTSISVADFCRNP